MADNDERARMRAERERRAAAAEARMRGLPPPTAQPPSEPETLTPTAAAAAGAERSPPPLTQTDAGPPVPTPAAAAPSGGLDGVMVRRVVPSDNSCLFAALGYVTRRSRAAARELREAAAAAVAADPFTFNEGFLGKANEEVSAPPPRLPRPRVHRGRRPPLACRWLRLLC